MILDLIVILIIVLFTFLGYKQGLVKTAIKIFSFLVAVIISMTFYKTVGNIIINNTSFDEKIEGIIVERILPENYEEKLSILPNALVETGEASINEMAIKVTEKIIYITAFLLLFIIIKLILKFVTIIADLITKLPIIKQFDKAGGLIYGLIKGFIIVTVIFALVSLISPMIEERYIEMINNSFIASKLYNNNLIIRLIK